MYWEDRRVVHNLNYHIRWKYEEGKIEGKNKKMTLHWHALNEWSLSLLLLKFSSCKSADIDIVGLESLEELCVDGGW